MGPSIDDILTLDREIVPRQLALETLYSIQCHLFPFYDEASRDFVNSKGWDPECVGADLASYCREDEDVTQACYWGPRWAALSEEIGTPKLAQSGKFWKWLSKRSGAEYLMLVTAAGVILGALLAAGALIVSALRR